MSSSTNISKHHQNGSEKRITTNSANDRPEKKKVKEYENNSVNEYVRFARFA